MTSTWARVVVIVAVSSFVAPGLAQVTKSAPIPVEVRYGGDDDLTLKLRGTLENAVRLSGYFSLNIGNVPGTLIIKIPANVERDPGMRYRLFYSVEFTSTDDQFVAKVSGACWDDKLSTCARQIIATARVAARKLKASELRP